MVRKSGSSCVPLGAAMCGNLPNADSSNSSLRSCTSCIMATAVTGLLELAIRKRVCGVVAVVLAKSEWPKPRAYTRRPVFATAAVAAGISHFFIKLVMNSVNASKVAVCWLGGVSATDDPESRRTALVTPMAESARKSRRCIVLPPDNVTSGSVRVRRVWRWRRRDLAADIVRIPSHGEYLQRYIAASRRAALGHQRIFPDAAIGELYRQHKKVHVIDAVRRKCRMKRENRAVRIALTEFGIVNYRHGQ